MRHPKNLLLSAQQVDPLSWFTGPYLPLAFSGLVFLFGTTITLLTWTVSRHPWMQFVGLGLAVVAGLVVHVRTRPLRAPVGWGTGALALVVATVGMAISAIDYAGTDMNLGVWWGPAAPALVLVGLSPYLTTRRVLVLGSVSSVVTVVVAMLVLYPTSPSQGPIAQALIFAYPPLMGLVAASVFSYSIVSTTLPLLDRPSGVIVPGQQVRSEAVAEVERVTLARLTMRAAPFLTSIVEAGSVTASDRALAGQLARRLRDDLLTQANVSWLDTIAKSNRLVVVDPDHLARRMEATQRTAVLAMLEAILAMPETDAGSLMIELRPAADGATAAAISMDVTLPEGTRIMHLAPYYLTLRTAVDDLIFDRGRLTFRISPRDRYSPGDQER